MKDKEKEKDREKEKDNKKKAPPKKARESKRSAKIEDDEETPLKSKDAGADDEELDEEPDIDEDVEEEEEEEEEAPPAKSGKSKRMAKVPTPVAEKNGGDPGKPATRLALIRARHESMKREIDQIREDLDSDEEE